jgi:hypothetical protein
MSIKRHRFMPKSAQNTGGCAFQKPKAADRCQPPQAYSASIPTYGQSPDHGNGCCDGFSPNFPLIRLLRTKHAECSIVCPHCGRAQYSMKIFLRQLKSGSLANVFPIGEFTKSLLENRLFMIFAVLDKTPASFCEFKSGQTQEVPARRIKL